MYWPTILNVEEKESEKWRLFWSDSCAVGHCCTSRPPVSTVKLHQATSELSHGWWGNTMYACMFTCKDICQWANMRGHAGEHPWNIPSSHLILLPAKLWAPGQSFSQMFHLLLKVHCPLSSETPTKKDAVMQHKNETNGFISVLIRCWNPKKQLVFLS